MTDRTLSAGFAASATFMVSISATASFGALDVMLRMGSVGLLESVQLAFLWLAFGTVLAVPACLAAALMASYLRKRLDRPTFAGGLVAIAFSMVALMTLLSRAWAIAVLPAGCLLGGVLVRVKQLEYIRHLAILSLALVVFLMLATGAGSALEANGRGAVAALLLVLTPAVWLVHRGAVLRPSATLYALVVAAVLFAAVCFGPWEGHFAPPALGIAQHGGWGPWPGARGDTGRTRRPNVVLIVLDTTRRDYIGAYGAAGGLTPNFDKLAAEGTLYEDAISTADWTVPSHASLFTGLYPVTHGASTAHHRWLDDRFTTLAEMLREAGYQTAGFVANPYIHAANLDQGFDYYVSLGPQNPGAKLYQLTSYTGFPARWADKGAAEAPAEVGRWLSRASASRKPIFLFVNLLEPHWRYLPPWPWRMTHLPGGVSYWAATRLALRFGTFPALARGRATAWEKAINRAMYAAAVQYQDSQLGRLLAVLRVWVDLDNTLLIVTADHGENLGESGRWDHVFAVNDYLLRVPLVIRHPPHFPAGVRMPGQCQLVDVVPTVCGVAGCRPPGGLPGRTLLPAAFRAREFAFSESSPDYGHLQEMAASAGPRRGIVDFTAVLRAVRTGRYKYVWSSRGNHKLFDLKQDPEEAVDVLPSKGEVGRHLKRALQAWWAAQLHYQPSQADRRQAEGKPEDSATVSAGDVQRLRALGYVQ